MRLIPLRWPTSLLVMLGSVFVARSSFGQETSSSQVPNEVRTRWGLGVEAGGGGGDQATMVGGMSFRFGAQFNGLMSAYLQPRLLLGGAFDSGFYGAFQLAGLVELTLPKPVPGRLTRNVLLALGPAIDLSLLGGCECSPEPVAIGAEVRLAVALHPVFTANNRPHRQNVFLTFAARPTVPLEGEFQLTGLLGIGMETF